MNNPTPRRPANPSAGPSQPRLWKLPFSSQTFEIGKFKIRLWITLQIGLTLIVSPILTVVVMELLTSWGWVGHSDNFADLHELSPATLGFYGMLTIGAFIVASIPLPVDYGDSVRVLLRSVLFIVSLILFWPVLFLMLIISMMCFGSGFS